MKPYKYPVLNIDEEDYAYLQRIIQDPCKNIKEEDRNKNELFSYMMPLPDENRYVVLKVLNDNMSVWVQLTWWECGSPDETETELATSISATLRTGVWHCPVKPSDDPSLDVAVIQSSFHKIDPVLEITCPHCNKVTTVTASAITGSLEHARAPIVVCGVSPEGYEPQNYVLSIDWDKIDMEADFEYLCDECGERVASSLDELETMYVEQIKRFEKKCSD